MSQLSYRDAMLLLREYFNARDVAGSSHLAAGLGVDSKLKSMAVLKEAETEKKLRKLCESFTISETAELPFRFKDVSEIELTEEEREDAIWEGKTKKFHHLRALERNNKNLKA
jgi:hypothetical protein